jgi:membrane protease YdiL (CAAX protease family)
VTTAGVAIARDVRFKSLLEFWALAFLVSWGAGTLVAVSNRSALVNGVQVHGGALTIPFAVALVLLLISGSGPAIAAITVCAVDAKLGGVRALLSQVLHWRTWPGWYVVALLLPTLLTLLVTGIWAAATAVRPARWLPLPTLLQLAALPLFPWGEEIGWRGFAMPRLQTGLRWLPASVIVGVMWGLWHQWPLLTPAAGGLDLPGLGVFFAYIVSDSVLIGWAYERGGRKLPLGWAGHAGLNAVGPTAAPFGLVAAALAGAALALAAFGDRGAPVGSRSRRPPNA